MSSKSFELPTFRGNAKVIGNEVGWRGTDILDVLKETMASGLAVVGIESVRFPCGDGRPLVEAISDRCLDLKEWKQSLPWVHCILRSGSRAMEDIERNVKEPYRADVWYIVYGENREGTVLTADP